MPSKYRRVKVPKQKEYAMGWFCPEILFKTLGFVF